MSKYHGFIFFDHCTYHVTSSLKLHTMIASLIKATEILIFSLPYLAFWLYKPYKTCLTYLLPSPPTLNMKSRTILWKSGWALYISFTPPSLKAWKNPLSLPKLYISSLYSFSLGAKIMAEFVSIDWKNLFHTGTGSAFALIIIWKDSVSVRMEGCSAKTEVRTWRSTTQWQVKTTHLELIFNLF